MKKLLLVVAIAAMGLLASCTVTQPFAVTSNPLSKDAKVGTSSYITLFGAINLGDAGINLAAKKAGITKISVVDVEVTNYAGIYAKVKTFVYGD
jgi:hypothetical protein